MRSAAESGDAPTPPAQWRSACWPSLLAGAALAFDLEGHRGARGLAPENTLPAFARALDIGVTTLELDVALTADGVLVVSHDPFLNPVLARDADGQWLPGPRGPLIHALTLAQVQAYDVGRIRPDTPYARTFATQQAVDGTRLPTLAQVFALVQARGGTQVRFNIETKLYPDHPEDTAPVAAMTDALLQAIRTAGLRERVTIQSFDWRSLRRVQQLEPGIPTACLTVQSSRPTTRAIPPGPPACCSPTTAASRSWCRPPAAGSGRPTRAR